jgi:hypothetical protein
MFCKNDEVVEFFNDGQPFKLNKEKYSLSPNSKLVGTSWRVYNDDGYAITLYFKSEYEVLFNGETCLYTCLGNNVAIKSGDDIHSENLIGTYNSQNIKLCRDGIGRKASEDYFGCLTMKRIE